MAKTIVFLHGYLESATIWQDLSKNLDARCICPDLLGHGDNKTDKFSTIRDMSEDVLEFLKEENIDSYAIVGHSMGGYVALDLMKRDKRCEKVMLLNSNFWEDSPEKKKDRLRVVEAVKHNKNRFVREVIPNLFASPQDHEELIEGLVVKAEAMTVEAIGNASLAMRSREDNSDFVKARAKDIVIVQGKSDNVMPVDVMLEKAPNGIALEILNCGHMSWCELPKETSDLIRDHLL